MNVVQPSVRCGPRFAAAAAVLVAAWLATPARAQPAPSEFALVDSLELDEPPHVIKRVDPVTARYVTEHIEGTVLVLARVGKDGLVREPRVLHSIPPLDSAAVRAARQWVFSPALRDGKPIAVWITIPIRFSADGRGPVPPEVQARRDHEAAQAAFDGGCAELRARGAVAPSDSDALLRERVIRAHARLARPPAVPKDAWDEMGRGLASLGDDEADLALDAFAQALFDAPWWGEAYRQIARAQEMVGRRADAAASLELYLVANPQEPNWEDVRTRIRALRGLKP